MRDRPVAQLGDETLDLLVIGGGIVGSGVARDAAMRGLSTGLVEQHDFAYGTSSRSSRLLHGGLRYLAQGRVGLVREASREKTVLHRIAPHLVAPLPFVFPAYRGSPWPLWQLRIGVKAYDLLCSGKNLGASESLSRDEVIFRIPYLRGADLLGAVRYYDGLTNDARLVLDTLKSAESHGALLANYLKVDQVQRDGKLWRCRVTDRLDGKTQEIRAKSIVHATGPWAGSLEPSGIRIRPTKGVHLVLDRNRLPIPDAVVMTDEDRIMFAIPWGSRVILGTTDTDYDGTPEDVRTTPEDVDSILQVTNQSFPAIGLTPDDIISTWSGLRPLVAKASGKPSDISRAHVIRMAEPGWFDIAGGKLTTYRLIAQQAVDRVLKFQSRRAAACRTGKELLLPEGEGDQFSSLLPPDVTREAVTQFCRHQWAVHLEDVMIRRTSWHQYLPNAREVAGEVADWMADLLDWSPNRKAEELARYVDSFA